jgi:hypothetical protein
LGVAVKADSEERSHTVNTPKKIDSAYMKPIYRALLVYALIGCAIYLAASWAPIKPNWALSLIETLKPMIGGLNTAARVSDQPFAVQMLTIYVFFASIPLTFYSARYFLFDTNTHNTLVAHHLKRNTRRFTLLFGGLFFVIFLPMQHDILMSQVSEIGWRDRSHYQPGLSAIVISIGGIVCPLVGVIGIKTIMLAMFGLHRKPNQNKKITQ